MAQSCNYILLLIDMTHNSVYPVALVDQHKWILPRKALELDTTYLEQIYFRDKDPTFIPPGMYYLFNKCHAANMLCMDAVIQ